MSELCNLFDYCSDVDNSRKEQWATQQREKLKILSGLIPNGIDSSVKIYRQKPQTRMARKSIRSLVEYVSPPTAKFDIDTR